MLGRFAWWKVISENRHTISKLVGQGFQAWWQSKNQAGTRTRRQRWRLVVSGLASP